MREGTNRLIKKHPCVSCKNRECELVKGRNARGMVPTKLAPLVAHRVFYFSNGRVHLVRSDRTTSDAELAVATLQDAVHGVAFAWAGPRFALGQLHGARAVPGPGESRRRRPDDAAVSSCRVRHREGGASARYHLCLRF